MSKRLKEDLELLSKLFPKTHERFQITRHSPEGIHCVFIDSKGQKIPLSATLKDTPGSTVSAVWYTDTEEQQVSDTLSSVSGENAFVIQVRKVISSLCSIYNVAPPSELSQLVARATKSKESVPSSASETKTDDETNWFMSFSEDESNESTSASDVPSEKAVDKALEKARTENLKKRLKGLPAGTSTANFALMKEFKEIQKSDSVTKGVFTAELVQDNLFEWFIKISQVDPDSKLAEDLKKLKEQGGQACIHLKLRFTDNFPLEPPIAAVVWPRMTHGHVIEGAICMELLTKQGWSSAYTVEGIILQIISTFAKGEGRINFENKEPYDMQTAASWAKHLEQFHKQQGWYTPPKGSG